MSDHLCYLYEYVLNTFCILFYLFIYWTIELMPLFVAAIW
jgi:hypothetical protein